MVRPKKKTSVWRWWYQELITAWWQHRGSTMAAAISYRALFSLVPLAMALLLVVNLVSGIEWLVSEVETAGRGIGAGVMEQMAQQIEVDEALLSLPPAFLWLVLLIMLYGASTVFRELTLSLTVIFGTEKQRWWQGNVWLRLGAFLTVLGVGGLLVLFTMGQWALAALEEVLISLAPQLSVGMQIIEWAMAPVLLLTFLLLIYRWLPMKKYPVRDILPGALVTTLFLWGGQSLMIILIQNAQVTTAFGAAGWVLGFLLWVYYSALILLFGAEVVQLTPRFKRWRETRKIKAVKGAK